MSFESATCMLDNIVFDLVQSGLLYNIPLKADLQVSGIFRSLHVW